MPEAHDMAEASDQLVAVFSRIAAERMEGVPILNPKLAVEAVGMREWNGHRLSALITPWFINLMLLPMTEAQGHAWRSLAPGSSVPHAFPAGRFDFLVGEEGGLARYQMCSLFSPVLEFEDQDAARLTATAALEALFNAHLDKACGHEQTEAAAAPPRGVSRRGLLRGKLVSEGETT
jgi:[NiFe] hydrogenase assembly HybE family chaperone